MQWVWIYRYRCIDTYTNVDIDVHAGRRWRCIGYRNIDIDAYRYRCIYIYIYVYITMYMTIYTHIYRCGLLNDVPPDYYCSLDQNGKRRDQVPRVPAMTRLECLL